ncbi:MAG: flavodoxin domain-containing protein, partial [Verrucomicrobiota bacterium]|nr:flavodoxin domain-containing protein [Verrucomicrobiota bacterium]
MNNSKTNLNNESTKSDFLSKIDNLTKNLTSDELLKLSNYIMLKADSSNSSNDSFNGLTILYGSQTGNSRSIAEELFDEAKKKNINSTLISMAKMKEKSIKNIENLLLIVSTQGEGDPPDDALNLVDFINGNKAPK